MAIRTTSDAMDALDAIKEWAVSVQEFQLAKDCRDLRESLSSGSPDDDDSDAVIAQASAAATLGDELWVSLSRVSAELAVLKSQEACEIAAAGRVTPELRSLLEEKARYHQRVSAACELARDVFSPNEEPVQSSPLQILNNITLPVTSQTEVSVVEYTAPTLMPGERMVALIDKDVKFNHGPNALIERVSIGSGDLIRIVVEGAINESS